METTPKRNKHSMSHAHTSNFILTNSNINLPFLGEDALFNIFVRCDPRTVGRVRCTSNTWRWRLRVPEFARLNWTANDHRSCTALVGYGYSSYGEKSHWATQVNAGDGSLNVVRLPFEIIEAGYFTIIGSDNGNLCLKYAHTGEDMEILVVNPLTKSVVHIDDQSFRFRFCHLSVYAFGYLKDSTEFRVIYLYKDRYKDKNLKWMLWNSCLQCWKTRGVYITEIVKVRPTSVVVGGVAFWIGWGGFFNLEPIHLLTFSLEEEIFF
ncbi:hypothetical protein PIB30_066251 [Stylosanthes scabra]|uniref:F-box domain-containing protein n=1 Tax=Stylosanthes scabra TaxID=79078 RepID=A0ABU6YNJ6_9FABA|nr:hypothetical protein [Stylosanthes scabra]